MVKPPLSRLAEPIRLLGIEEKSHDSTGDWVICPHKLLDELSALQVAALKSLKDYAQPRGQLAEWKRADGKPLRKTFERLAKLVNYEWKERSR